MASGNNTGWVNPSSVVESDTGSEWFNEANAKTEDGSFAQSTVLNLGDSKNLEATGYDFSVIPSNAIIKGIEARIKRSASAGTSIRDDNIRLLNAGGGSENKRSLTAWPTTLTFANYGGDGDLWNLSYIAVKDVKDSSFGFFLAAENIHSTISYLAQVDVMQLKVYYNIPAVPNFLL